MKVCEKKTSQSEGPPLLVHCRCARHEHEITSRLTSAAILGSMAAQRGELWSNYRGIRSRASDRCDRATEVSKEYIRSGQEGPRDFLLVCNSGAVVATTTGE